MIIDDSALEKIKELDIEYKRLTGRPVNYKFLPKNVSQEQILRCLELMIEENLSISVAYQKLYGNKQKEKE